jgi:cysteine desulfurase family protein (TIGR01976 family)
MREMTKPTNLEFCREEFPALELRVNGRPAIFLDGPGGTQVPQRVVEKVSYYLKYENSNTHGAFATSQATDSTLQGARRAMADMLGADTTEIAFGANMTTLNYALSRALARDMNEGDEVIITELDHEANRGPWLALEEQGIRVREVSVDLDTLTLDMGELEATLNSKTRVVAVGGASNATGTINDVQRISRWAHEVGAVCVVDAVHLVPHKPVDVNELGCDFLLCSAYKFFGPHVGILYGGEQAFDKLAAYHLLPQSDEAPHKIETGTLNHEGIAGVTATVDFIADIGREAGEPAAFSGTVRRRAVLAGMTAIAQYEEELADWFRSELAKIPGLCMYSPPDGHARTPTFSFVLDKLPAPELAAELGRAGVFAWDGDFYATTLVDKLGLQDSGGLLRLGLAPYNTLEELKIALGLIRELAQ